MIIHFKIFEDRFGGNSDYYVTEYNKHLYVDELKNFKFKLGDYVEYHSWQYGVENGSVFQIVGINISFYVSKPYQLCDYNGILQDANERELELVTDEKRIEEYKLKTTANKYNI